MSVATKVRLNLEGKDNTAKAFQSAKKNADGFGASMKSALKVAAGAAVIKKAFDAVAQGLETLNVLNDTAQRAGVSAEWLQRFSGAMGQAGIQMQQTDIVGSIQKLNAGLVNTEKINALQKLGIDVSHLKGLKPEEAFMGFLDVVSKIPDEQTRLLALMRGMEEQGLKLAPLMRQGPEAFRSSLDAVMSAIPAASDQTVTLATNANNAFALVGQSFQTIWHEVLGGVLTWADQSYGGVDKAIMRTWEYTKAYTLSLARATQQWGENVGGIIALFQFDFIDALEVLTYRIAQWGYILMRPFAKLSAMLGADGLLNAIELVDAEIQRRIERIYESHGFEPTTTLAEKIGQDFLEAQQNIERWDLALEAKKNLSAFSAGAAIAELPKIELPKMEPAVMEPFTTALQTSVTSAVSSGTAQGLAQGIEAGSYEALKTAMASMGSGFYLGSAEEYRRRLAAAHPTLAAGGGMTAGGSVASAAVASSGSATKPVVDRMGEMITVLKSILSQTQSLAGTAKTLEAF